MLYALATVTYVATIVALWGILSLVLDRNPIDYTDAGPLLGPAMVAASAVITWLIAWRSQSAWVGATTAFFASFFGMIVVAVVGYVGSPFEVALHFAISPFIAGAALFSSFTVLATAALRRIPSS
jgi:small basic protein